MFDEIINMRKHYELPIPTKPLIKLPTDFCNFRLKLLTEEFEETKHAIEQNDIVEVADGLVDLTVIAMGTAAGLGIDFNACWSNIMASNLSKSRGIAKNTKRKHKLDLIKGEEYFSPNLLKIIENQTEDQLSTPRMGALFEAFNIRKMKESDYQRSGLSKADYFPFGLTSYMQMIWVKTMRLKSLHDSKQGVLNESIRDSLLDLINYASFAVEALDRGEI